MNNEAKMEVIYSPDGNYNVFADFKKTLLNI